MKHDKDGNIGVMRQIQTALEALASKYLPQHANPNQPAQPPAQNNSEYEKIQSNLELVKTTIARFERARSPSELPYNTMQQQIYRLLYALIANPLCEEIAGFALANLLDLDKGEELLSFAFAFGSIQRNPTLDSNERLSIYGRLNNAFAQILPSTNISAVKTAADTLGITYGYYVGKFKCPLSGNFISIPILDKEISTTYSLPALSGMLKSQSGVDKDPKFFLHTAEQRLNPNNFMLHPTYCRDLADTINLPTKFALRYDIARTLFISNLVALPAFFFNLLASTPSCATPRCEPIIFLSNISVLLAAALLVDYEKNSIRGVKHLYLPNLAYSAFCILVSDSIDPETKTQAKLAAYAVIMLSYTAFIIANTPQLQQQPIYIEPKQAIYFSSALRTPRIGDATDESTPLQVGDELAGDVEARPKPGMRP